MCSTVKTGEAFVADAVAHGMTVEAAQAWDGDLAAAEARIMELVEAGRLDEAEAFAAQAEAAINARFGG